MVLNAEILGMEKVDEIDFMEFFDASYKNTTNDAKLNLNGLFSP